MGQPVNLQMENDMKDMFKDAKAGDRVFDILRGWGTVAHVGDMVDVEFDSGVWGRLYPNGKLSPDDLHPTLYWAGVELPPPPNKPLPDLAVDMPILVTNGREEHCAHFHSYAPDGGVYVYAYGRTSHTTSRVGGGSSPNLTHWMYWRLPEEN